MNSGIVQWLNKQPIWIREASRRIFVNGVLAENDYKDLLSFVKSPDICDIELGEGYSQVVATSKSSDTIRINAIGKIENIDNLSPTKPLVFGSENLSVVYGNNGSGKSGYVRILKNASGKMGSGKLKPNVYKIATSDQSCDISYLINGNDTKARWIANGNPLDDLRSLGIFDDTCCRMYIDDESEPSYLPPELVYFTDLVNACDTIDKALQTEQAALVKKLPELPPRFSRTVAGINYTNLSLDLDQTKLDELRSWTDEDAKMLTDINTRLTTGDPAVEARKRCVVKEQIDQIVAQIDIVSNFVSKEFYITIAELRLAARQKRSAALDGARVLSNVSIHDGVGSETWRLLWNAAREYSTTVAYVDKPFPNIEEHSRCIFCHQQLDNQACDRLRSFETYMTGKLQQEAENSEIELNNTMGKIPIMPTEESIIASCQVAELSNDLRDRIGAVWKEIRQNVQCLKTATTLSDFKSVSPSLECLVTELNELLRYNENLKRQYENDAKSFNRAVISAEALELQAREWTAQQMGAIKTELERLEKVCQYDKWRKLTSTTSISKKASEVSENLLTDAYIARFNDELKNLGAKHISVELVKTRVSQGRSMHQVKLKGLAVLNTDASDILSEGEKGVVSLAAFLADTNGKPSVAPLIFDDPISSLDQLYEEKTIDRLVQLSKDRQVIVFTHRLSFVGMIYDRVTSEVLSIRCETWGSGEPCEVPLFAKKPENALRDLKNGRLSRAKVTYINKGYDAYYQDAKSICGDIRILTERIVESILLFGIVQRHRREVQTKGKIHKLCQISQNDCAMIDEIMTDYSCYEHSQSQESPIELPKPEKLEADIDKILSWTDEFKGRHHE